MQPPSFQSQLVTSPKRYLCFSRPYCQPGWGTKTGEGRGEKDSNIPLLLARSGRFADSRPASLAPLQLSWQLFRLPRSLLQLFPYYSLTTVHVLCPGRGSSLHGLMKTIPKGWIRSYLLYPKTPTGWRVTHKQYSCILPDLAVITHL